jgi:hypothetical protein
MALETERKIKELTDNVLPGRVKEIEEICGALIPYEVDWASFSEGLWLPGVGLVALLVGLAALIWIVPAVAR